MNHSSNVIPRRVLLRMLRYHVTSPYVFLWRTIELSVMVALAERHGIDLQTHVDLDVGCGNGVLGHALIRDIALGLDMSKSGVAWAHAHKPAYRAVLEASATAMPLEDASQQVVFSNSVIEHIPYIDAVYDELGRVTAPGGYVILSTVSQQFRTLMLGDSQPDAQTSAEIDRSYDHYHYFSASILRDALAARGLEVLDSASYINADQARWCHELRRWEQRQRRDGLIRRANQLRRAPVGLAVIPRMYPLLAPAGEGVGLAIIARRSA